MVKFKNKKKELSYLFYPKWKIIENSISSLNLDDIKGEEKKGAKKLIKKIRKQLKRNKILGIIIISIYFLIYFSIISIFLSFSQIYDFLNNIISKILNLIGTPILILLVYILNRIMTNRYQDINITLMKLISKLKNK